MTLTARGLVRVKVTFRSYRNLEKVAGRGAKGILWVDLTINVSFGPIVSRQ